MLISNLSKQIDMPIKALLYGASGVGKTSAVKSICAIKDERVLIVSSESGLLSLQGENIDVIDIALNDKGLSIPKEKRLARLSEVYTFLLTEQALKTYTTIYIDSLTEISQNILEQLQVEFPDRKDSLVLFGESAKKMRGLIKSFRDLPKYNVVMTALSEVDFDETKRRYILPCLVGKIKETIAGYFDLVLYLEVIKNDQGQSVRRLHTSANDVFVAKDRSGKLNAIESTLGEVFTKIKGVVK